VSTHLDWIALDRTDEEPRPGSAAWERAVEDRARIRALVQDLPSVWRAATTMPADRKAMLRLAIEAIVLRPVHVPRRVTVVQVQWQGGAVSELQVPRPQWPGAMHTRAATLARVGELAAADLRDEEIAERLNGQGLLTGRGRPWDCRAARWARRRAGIRRREADEVRVPPLPDRHPDGRYSVPGVARRFGVSTDTVRQWIARGLVSASRADLGRYHDVWWFELDEPTVARLERLAREVRNRR